MANMTDKTLDESQFSLDLALSWCLNAKNSLANAHRFSPFQLALGQNQKLPPTLIDKPPALTLSNTSKTVTDNLAALHKAREVFISCEKLKKIGHALSKNMRGSEDTKNISGTMYISKEPVISTGKDLGRF